MEHTFWCKTVQLHYGTHYNFHISEEWILLWAFILYWSFHFWNFLLVRIWVYFLCTNASWSLLFISSLICFTWCRLDEHVILILESASFATFLNFLLKKLFPFLLIYVLSTTSRTSYQQLKTYMFSNFIQIVIDVLISNISYRRCVQHGFYLVLDTNLCNICSDCICTFSYTSALII